MEITKKHLKILENVAYYSSKKLMVDRCELTSYLMNRLPNIKRNFVPELGKDFNTYLTISLRFYSLNYLRDCSWSTKVSAKELTIYSKILKWKTLKVASRRLGIPVNELREIRRRVNSNRNNYNVPMNKVKHCVSDTETTNNIYVKFVQSLGGIEAIKTYDPDELKKKFQLYV